MPAVKICPFCMVDAHTDAATCSYCGSSYDQVGPVAAACTEGVHTRPRSYDGTASGASDCLGALSIANL